MLVFPNKAIRAQAIKEYIAGQGYAGAVCCSCGNASRELRLAGVHTIDISPTGDLIARRWFTQNELHSMFPTYFDATSGHLPFQLMAIIAARYKMYIDSRFGGIPGPEVVVPTGSGETLFCLKLAYPEARFIAAYNLDEATRYDKENPFNVVVEAIAAGIDYGES